MPTTSFAERISASLQPFLFSKHGLTRQEGFDIIHNPIDQKMKEIKTEINRIIKVAHKDPVLAKNIADLLFDQM